MNIENEMTKAEETMDAKPKKTKTGIPARYENVQFIKEDLLQIKEKNYSAVTHPNKQKLIALGYITSETVKSTEKKPGRPKKDYFLTQEAETFVSKQ